MPENNCCNLYCLEIEGLGIGENRLGELMEQLLSRGRISNAQKAATDKTARARLYKEFGIE